MLIGLFNPYRWLPQNEHTMLVIQNELFFSLSFGLLTSYPPRTSLEAKVVSLVDNCNPKIKIIPVKYNERRWWFSRNGIALKWECTSQVSRYDRSPRVYLLDLVDPRLKVTNVPNQHMNPRVSARNLPSPGVCRLNHRSRFCDSPRIFFHRRSTLNFWFN